MESDHANHPYRESDVSVLIIMVATIVSSMWVTFWSIISTLGSGLASTPDTPVPQISNVLWYISGYAIIVCIVLFMVTLITRRRVFGIALGLVVLAAGISLTVGRVIDWHENDSATSMLESIDIPGLIIPIIASAVNFWNARGLLP